VRSLERWRPPPRLSWTVSIDDASVMPAGASGFLCAIRAISAVGRSPPNCESLLLRNAEAVRASHIEPTPSFLPYIVTTRRRAIISLRTFGMFGVVREARIHHPPSCTGRYDPARPSQFECADRINDDHGTAFL